MAQTLMTAVNWSEVGGVVLLGVGVVFSGLVALILLVYLMNFISDKFSNNGAPKKAEAPAVAPVQNDVIPNREELVAAVCAAIAEEEGTDISAIRVVSIKKV